MHRNTYLVVSMLASVAALLIGINIGRRLPSANPLPIQQQPTPSAIMSGKPVQASSQSYRNAFCKIGFDYPAFLSVLENASGSAAFTGPNADDGILMTCQKSVPTPSVSLEEVEEVRIGSVAAKLYVTKTASAGATMDTLIFRHPGTKLDVFLAGTGEIFRKLISSITLLP